MQAKTQAMKYSYRTRVGNWSEEWDLDEVKIKDSKQAQQQSNLISLNSESKKNLTLRKAALSYVPAGELVDGAKLVLYNPKFEAGLAVNIGVKIPGADEMYSVAGSKTAQPLTRTVFKLEKVVEGRRIQSDPYIHYGDKVRIVANERIFGSEKKFYLISQAVGFQSQAKLSGKQEVLLTSKLSTASLWEFEHSDYRVRFDAVGQKVKAGECVLLKHVNTSQWLAYGKEHEIFVHSYLKQSKSHNLLTRAPIYYPANISNLASEQAGRVTIDIPLRGQEDQNAWVLITARTPQEDFDDRVIDQPLQADRIIDDLRATLQLKGSSSLRVLRAMLYKIDTKQSKTIDSDDLRWGLRNIGVELSQAEVDLLVAAFDPSQFGQAEYEYILESLNICTGPERIALIRDTYNEKL